MKKHIAHIISLLIGLVFLFSAFAKAWSGNKFADLVIMYGADWLSAFVPLLILTETLLATLLILNLFPKRTLLCSIIFIAFVSAFFLYGVLVRGINDCGCFGSLHFVNSKPWVTFVRNAILISLLYLAYRFSDSKKTSLPVWKIAIILLLTSSSTFICGLDMSKSFTLPHSMTIKHKDTQTVEELGLDKYITLSNDSSYAVYLFSYSCAYCQNSFANVEQYLRIEQIDHVYGLAIDDSVAKERFFRIYDPQIDIVDIPDTEMAEIVSDLPVLLIIKEGKVVHTESGSVVSPLIGIE